jgi:hypothetical protein
MVELEFIRNDHIFQVRRPSLCSWVRPHSSGQAHSLRHGAGQIQVQRQQVSSNPSSPAASRVGWNHTGSRTRNDSANGGEAHAKDYFDSKFPDDDPLPLFSMHSESFLPVELPLRSSHRVRCAPFPFPFRICRIHRSLRLFCVSLLLLLLLFVLFCLHMRGSRCHAASSYEPIPHATYPRSSHIHYQPAPCLCIVAPPQFFGWLGCFILQHWRRNAVSIRLAHERGGRVEEEEEEEDFGIGKGEQ